MRERDLDRASWAVHTVLYEGDREMVRDAWQTLNVLPRPAVFRAASWYGMDADLLRSWLLAGDILRIMTRGSEGF
jgi:hypothetical protein